ncbi:MAG: hypothetical protein V3V67_12315 [Myxococcota bacterium]
MRSGSSKRARLIVLEEAEPAFELGVVGALLGSEAPEGAIVIAALVGDAAALGRYQRPGRTGHTREVRRLTGGRSTLYGDGILTLSAVIPSSQAWLEDREELPGPRLLNRYVRGLLAALRSCGLPAVYPGRDFVTVAGRRVAYVTLERSDSGALVFQAVIGTTGAYVVDDASPDFPGLATLPEATWIEREGGDPHSLRALAASYAGRFSLDLIDAPAPQPVGAPPLERALPPHPSGAIPIPIGQLEAHVELAADGTLARLNLAGDWIASSAEVLMLEQALVGKHPDPELLSRVIDRWLRLPGNLTIGVVSATPVVEAIRSAASHAEASA